MMRAVWYIKFAVVQDKIECILNITDYETI